ncbi:MAG: hypothetical protein JWR80_8908 [Bradyrhizobium sp.]|nr:hypothetical protein [Bradyrhizobium sp.]
MIEQSRRQVAALLWFALAISALATVIVPAPLRAQSPSVTAPATLSIESGTAETIAISAQGLGTGNDVVLSVVPSPGITAKPVDRMVAKGGLTWLVRIAIDPGLGGDTNLTFRVARRSTGGVAASATVKVTPRTAAGSDTLVSAEVIQDGEMLLDGQPGTILLKITNKSDAALQVRRVRYYPQATLITLVDTDDGAKWVIAPRSVLIHRVNVRVNPHRPLTSGKHMIGFVVSLRRLSASRPWTGDVVATRDVTTGVPGMTDIQNILQVPSFLLLPGFLILVTFFLVWRTRPQPAAAMPAPAFSMATSPNLWVGAITISGIIVSLYPLVTGWTLGVQRNILYGYDLGDLVRVWLGSIVLGTIVGLSALLVDRRIRRYRTDRLFQAGEDPFAFLHRLARMEMSHRFPYVSEGAPVKQFKLFRLAQNPGATELWAAPAIAIAPAPGKTPQYDAVALADASSADNVTALIALLEPDVSAGNITLSWISFAGIDGPIQVERARFNDIKEDRLQSIVDAG